jgi:hypothetical protein
VLTLFVVENYIIAAGYIVSGLLIAPFFTVGPIRQRWLRILFTLGKLGAIVFLLECAHTHYMLNEWLLNGHLTPAAATDPHVLRHHGFQAVGAVGFPFALAILTRWTRRLASPPVAR